MDSAHASNDSDLLPEIPNSKDIPEDILNEFTLKMLEDLDLPSDLLSLPVKDPVFLVIIRLYQQNLVLERELEDFKAIFGY